MIRKWQVIRLVITLRMLTCVLAGLWWLSRWVDVTRVTGPLCEAIREALPPEAPSSP